MTVTSDKIVHNHYSESRIHTVDTTLLKPFYAALWFTRPFSKQQWGLYITRRPGDEAEYRLH
ncbi:unnamed protein product [Acanthoscelides obtectus]|uniref:Uncharacterized protein n=1 Tax=Acanthoscelides obtectus TaxID=200917 RepID=A0A9P0NXA2_ACAOB|nr:unnamed protein product [Acanthoscelides obtectus]CAK1662172.1 hypothetical protein AOBTE_LOCUS23023 [Acanthoscelides obtectus]